MVRKFNGIWCLYDKEPRSDRRDKKYFLWNFRIDKSWIVYSIVLIGILFNLSSCKKINLDEINNLNGGLIYIIGHGGVGFKSTTNPLPENSFTSIKKAIEEQNAEGVEVDVQLSVDDKLILFHDGKLENSTYCSGCVNNLSASSLQECQYLPGTNLSFHNEKLITLNKVLFHFSTRKVKPLVFLDTKIFFVCNPNISVDIQKRMITRINEIIQFYSAESWIHVMSGSDSFLVEMKKVNQNIKLWLDGGDFNTNVEIAKKNQFYGVSGDNSSVTEEEIFLAHENNIYALLFGMRSQSGITKAIRKNPDYIQTDNIPLTQRILID